MQGCANLNGEQMAKKSFFYPEKQGLYDPANEHDACGVGMVANIKGEQTHKIIEQGIEVLERLEHRGAVGGDPNTGDGAGLLLQIPDAFLRKACINGGITLPEAGSYGVAMTFLPTDEALAAVCREELEKAVNEAGLKVIGWRVVPTENDSLGNMAKETQPQIEQLFIEFGASKDEDDFELKLYVARRAAENAVVANYPAIRDRFYVCSMSCRTIVYKGMLMAPQVLKFFPDLADEEFVSCVAVVHQRYSTNTFPSWPLAHPFRYMAHNGEINTLRGNINQMRARENSFASEALGDDVKKLLPIVQEGGSDSASLDNAVEFFKLTGRSLAHTMMMLVPQAWGNKYELSNDLKGFYEYHAGFMEPWDGPAALVLTDGQGLVAALDRNGLRPARYTITNDDTILLASEAGTIDFPFEDCKKKGRLSPGEMLSINFKKGKIYFNEEVKTKIARQKPYRRWVDENKLILGDFRAVTPANMDFKELTAQQKLYGYTREELEMVVKPMAQNGQEATGSMGNDAALAVLSKKPQLLFAYFKQLFAQVTNPPIDPIREELVTSLTIFIGSKKNILDESPKQAELVKIKSPILSNDGMKLFRDSKKENFKAATVTISYPAAEGEAGLRKALDAIREESVQVVADGKTVLILSDKNLPEGHAPISSLLATSAVHHDLIRKGIRTSVGLVIETAEAREVMHFALLLGFGATAVNPYLALATIEEMVNAERLSGKNLVDAVKNYIKSIDKGLKKIMSKMGISTLRSYSGAQIFEAVGLSSELIEEYFFGTASKIEGIGLEAIAQETAVRYEQAQEVRNGNSRILETGGQYHFRADGENHLWSPTAITKAQEAVRTNNRELYKQYADEINKQARGFCTLRGLFGFKTAQSISIDKVEPVENIMKRFVTGAMSLGSISPEVHEAIAIAMNRINGMSNSGEGGEDPVRFTPMENGDNKCSAIKQIASGRFGVTIEYLSNAKELQIKIAQGAKPGEGGQLPGDKVNDLIARVRNSTPGVTLISPPPHHDIYSIEDLAQLIFDLKNANPEARISVKLVSEVGVGTVAAGVSKGHADMVLIAGHDGGTGASPLTSIKHCGLPWELGLAETQQTLVLNKLRDRIRVQADGQMKTGRDIVIAGLLGAEEFGFGTLALVALGCVMMRKCHSNTCPVGVATQDEELRKRFNGAPDHLITFLRFIAEEVREYMAELGFENFDDLVGRSDLLEMDEAVDFWKAKNLDFSPLFAQAEDKTLPVRCTTTQDHGIDQVLDQSLIKKAKKAIDKKEPIEFDQEICNLNRTTGTMLSGKIAKKHGNAGLPEDTIKVNFTGTAGQSFGTFLANGVTFDLAGEANDYVGKGLSGGKIIVRKPSNTSYKADENIIAGNVCLYGATGGELYINGMAGERFCIRNSGALTVVEGVGDHCCEYMTGGKTIVLGETGANFAAGMSGGLAYVYDEFGNFDERCNLSMVDLEQMADEADIAALKANIEKHVEYTGSTKAQRILENWEDSVEKFVKVFPVEYKRVLGKMMKEDAEIKRQPQQD